MNSLEMGIGAGHEMGRLHDTFFDKPERMERFTAEVYAVAQENLINPRAQITPAEGYCKQVNRVAAKLLRRDGIEAEYVEYTADRKVPHAFAHVLGERERIFDLQYKQFILPTHRNGLPDYMDIPYATPRDLSLGLQRHGIMKPYHKIWLSVIDNPLTTKQHAQPPYVYAGKQ
jgi:hypothetical protein